MVFVCGVSFKVGVENGRYLIAAAYYGFLHSSSVGVSGWFASCRELHANNYNSEESRRTWFRQILIMHRCGCLVVRGPQDTLRRASDRSSCILNVIAGAWLLRAWFYSPPASPEQRRETLGIPNHGGQTGSHSTCEQQLFPMLVSRRSLL